MNLFDRIKGWFRELKGGDKVIIKGYYNKIIATIDKITPTGRIKVNNDAFDHDGREIGAYDWRPNYLLKWTQEEEDEIAKQIEFKNMCYFLTQTNWKEKDYSLVESVYNIVKDK